MDTLQERIDRASGKIEQILEEEKLGMYPTFQFVDTNPKEEPIKSPIVLS